MANAVVLILGRTVICLCGYLLATASLCAQGTMGLVADPMNSNELNTYLKRYVSPTSEQWIVIEDVHGEYLEKFSQLRDGPIEDLLKEMYALNSSGGVPDIKSVEKYLASRERINGRIRRLDDECFGSMIELLREDQIAGLPRAQLARKRVRLQVGHIVPTIGSDLWTAIEAVDFDQDERATLVARLQAYEESATRLLKKANDAETSMLLRVVEGLEAHGFGDIDFSNPENMTSEVMQQFAEVHQEISAASMGKIGDVSVQFRMLNYRTLRELTNAVDPWKTLEVKRHFVQRTWGISYEDGHTENWTDFERYSRALCEKDELLGDLRDSVNELMEAYILAQHSRADRLLKIICEYNTLTMQVTNGEQAYPKEQIDAIKGEIKKAGEERTRQLFALIEEKGSTQLKELIKEPEGMAKYGDAPAVGQEQSLDLYVDEDVSPSGDLQSMGLAMNRRPLVPDAMSIKMLGKIRKRLGDDAVGSEALLEALYEEYLDQWKDQVVPLVQRMHEAEAKYMQWDPETSNPILDERAFAAQFDLRKQICEVAGSVDDRFFENLVLAMPDSIGEDFVLIIGERAMDRALTRTKTELSPYEESDEARFVNLVAVLNSLDISGDDRKLIDEVVIATLQMIVDAQFALRDVRFDVEEAMAREQIALTLEMSSGDQETSMDVVMRFQELGREAMQRVDPFEKKVNAMREMLLNKIEASVSDEVNKRFLTAFRVASYPSIFSDAKSAEPAFESAMKIVDLSPEQAEELRELLQTYQEDWFSRSHQMTEAQKELLSIDLMNGDGQQLQDWIAGNSKMDRARFDRDELSARALKRIARVLTPEQRQYVHALRGIEEEAGNESGVTREAAAPIQ